jgi:NAD(P)-dependent dehydrogenase (short-subunit alcohol dehydrogenase family)
MVETTVSELGGLHVLYNNAGVESSGDVVDATEEDWHRCLDVNAKGTFLCSKFAVPEMEASGGGSIINQGSVAALVGIRRFAAYCAAKGAVVALTRAMALDFAPRGIRVNCLCPGTVLTPLMEPMLRARGAGDLERGVELTAEKYPIGRLGSPEEIARVALFLASDDAAFVTGAVYTVDGGMTAQ